MKNGRFHGLAALVSGEIDFVLDPAPRDVARLRNTAGVKIIDGPENRIVFIGMDQGRDELLYSSVKGKNPFKDVRVRKALYQAVDIETMKTKLMNGQSYPSGGMTPSPKAYLSALGNLGYLRKNLDNALAACLRQLAPNSSKPPSPHSFTCAPADGQSKRARVKAVLA